MPTEARGNYLPEAPYLRETKTYLNCNRACSAWVHRTSYVNHDVICMRAKVHRADLDASESTLDSGTASNWSRHTGNQCGTFLFLLQKLCQIT